MRSPQRVADGRRHRVHVDVAAGEDLGNADGTHAAAVLQPKVPLGLVYLNDLLGNPVDIPEGHLGHPLEDVAAKRRIEVERADLVGNHPHHRLMPQPICTHHCMHRHAALRQPPGVFERRSRGLDSIDRNVVLEGAKDRIHVSCGTGGEQAHQLGVARELRDTPRQGVHHGPRQAG